MCITTNVSIELPKLPDNWEYTGEYRKPREGERYVAIVSPTECSVRSYHPDSYGFFFIVKAKRWRANHGGCYWFIDTNIVCEDDADLRNQSDKARWEAGNYFKTKSEAEAYA